MEEGPDQFSKPLKIENTPLATIYWLNPRDSKKGRLFMPVYDERHQWEFPVRFTYVSKFLERGNTAGNHYHNRKQEILIPLSGDFDIVLEDISTRARELHSIRSEENKAVYVRTGIAHKVVSKGETGVLLVLASHPSTLEDEIEYRI